MGVFDELEAKGMIAQITNEEKVKQLLNEDKIAFYTGFDPTAGSLHVGHFVQIMVMARMQRAGHTPIVLFGGDTGMIDDPSGKGDMRRMLTKEDIDHNIACFRKQMPRLIDFFEGKAIMANNGDWLLNLNYIEFIRKVGVHFSVSRMLAVEYYKQRLERGLSFFELNYMITQSCDLFELNERYNYILQTGGGDQWSNITDGVELIRRMKSEETYGITFTLLTTGEGKKMGKMKKGAVWLDPEKTSPLDLYQYWRNVDDADVVRRMKLLIFLPLSKIAEYEAMTGSELNQVKEVLAFEMTKLIHGEEEAAKAQEAARTPLDDGRNPDSMPSTELSVSDLADGSVGILEVMVKTGLIPSKGEGRKLIQQGGVSVDDQRITAVKRVLTATDLERGFVIIKKGKKVFHKMTLQR